MDTLKPHLKAVSFIHYGPLNTGKPRWFFGWRCEAVVDGIAFNAVDVSAYRAFRKLEDKLFEYELHKTVAENRRQIRGLTAHVSPELASVAATLATPGQLVEIEDPPRSWWRRLIGR